MSKSWFVWCFFSLSSLSAGAVPFRSMNSYTQALLCSSQLVAEGSKPTPEQLDNYAGKRNIDEIASRRLRFWNDFSRRNSAFQIPFVLAVQSRLRFHLADLPRFPMHAIEASDDVPAKIISGTTHVPPVLLLNVANYAEDPELVFVHASWKLWAVEQLRTNYRDPHSAFNLLKDTLVGTSGEDWQGWEKHLSREYRSGIKLIEERGVAPFSFGESKLVEVASELLSWMPTFYFYRQMTSRDDTRGWFESKFWEQAREAFLAPSSEERFYHWHLNTLGKRFNVETSHIAKIMEAVFRTNLLDIWDYNVTSPWYHQGLSHIAVNLSLPDGTRREVTAVFLTRQWWIKHVIDYPSDGEAGSQRKIVQFNLNPLADPNSRLRVTTAVGGEKKINFSILPNGRNEAPVAIELRVKPVPNVHYLSATWSEGPNPATLHGSATVSSTVFKLGREHD